MTCGIYLITNKITGQMYAGQSKHIEQRFKEHINQEALWIDKAISKYGSENFTFEILEELPEDYDLLNLEEIFWIEHLGLEKHPKHYNLSKGGDNREHLIGNVHSEETREKISKKVSGSNNGMYKGYPTISKNGIVNGKQQYALKYRGRIISRSQDISKLEYIRDFEDWDSIGKPKVSLIKDGSSHGKQKYSIMYSKVTLKTTYDLDKAKKYHSLAKFKLEGVDGEYYKNHLDEVFPCRRYCSKKPKDLNNILTSRRFTPNKEYKLSMSKKMSSTGIYRVSQESDRYRYSYREDGRWKSLCSVDLTTLKDKVLAKGLEWIEFDKEGL